MQNSFEVTESAIAPGAWFVRGLGQHAGEGAMLWGEGAEQRAKALAALLNSAPAPAGFPPDPGYAGRKSVPG